MLLLSRALHHCLALSGVAFENGVKIVLALSGGGGGNLCNGPQSAEHVSLEIRVFPVNYLTTFKER